MVGTSQVSKAIELRIKKGTPRSPGKSGKIGLPMIFNRSILLTKLNNTGRTVLYMGCRIGSGALGRGEELSYFIKVSGTKTLATVMNTAVVRPGRSIWNCKSTSSK
jgi:hypothetical protein